MNIVRKILTVAVFAAVLTLPVGVSATDAGGTPAEGPGISNPIRYDSLEEFLIAIVEGTVEIGFYFFVGGIIWSGFLFVKARGKPAEITKAHDAFLYTVIGGAILLGAFALANLIDSTVDTIRASHDIHLLS